MMGFASLKPILRSTLEIIRRLTSDPNRSSLGLLPSGPDPVGEWLVHRQPPAPYIGGSEGDCKRAAVLHSSPPDPIAEPFGR